MMPPVSGGLVESKYEQMYEIAVRLFIHHDNLSLG